jgi:hypothetical protein
MERGARLSALLGACCGQLDWGRVVVGWVCGVPKSAPVLVQAGGRARDRVAAHVGANQLEPRWEWVRPIIGVLRATVRSVGCDTENP